METSRIPHEVEVLVEVPRGGFVKRRANGAIDYVSPVPSPFNYGCVPGRIGGDGDPLDALVLGARLPRGAIVRARVHGVVRFVDDGSVDDKLICGLAAPSRRDLAMIHAFFTVYAAAKRVLNRARGRRGRSVYRGIDRAVPR